MSARSTSPVLTFDTLLASVVRLELSEKLRLRRLLEEEIAQAEEEACDEDPTVQAEIREARTAYAAGDYVTLDEYIAGGRRCHS
jgi:hypothetical protein